MFLRLSQCRNLNSKVIGNGRNPSKIPKIKSGNHSIFPSQFVQSSSHLCRFSSNTLQTQDILLQKSVRKVISRVKWTETQSHWNGDLVPLPQGESERHLVEWKDATWKCPESWIPFESTEEEEGEDTSNEAGERHPIFFGQDRIYQALSQLHSMKEGIVTVEFTEPTEHSFFMKLLTNSIPSNVRSEARDYVALHNFFNNEVPLIFELEGGTAETFQDALEKCDEETLLSSLSVHLTRKEQMRQLESYVTTLISKKKRQELISNTEGINIIVNQRKNESNRKKNGYPIHIIEESHPTSQRLLGWIKEGKSPAFRRVVAGSLLRASGGWLVTHVNDKKASEIICDAWENKSISIPSSDNHSYLSIPFQGVKVLIKMSDSGEAEDDEEENDQSLEKLDWISDMKPDSTTEVKTDEENVKNFSNMVRHMIQSKDLLPFDRSAIQSIVEFCVKEGERREISISRAPIASLLKSSDAICYSEGLEMVSKPHVEKAIELIHKSTDAYQTAVVKMILENMIMISTTGSVIGQNNGLVASANYGLPSRTTGTVAPGRRGVVNVQKESGQAGKHLRQTLPIINGFIKSRYCLYEYLGIDATICSEQTYEAIDGDSGSISDTCAILSALSGLPLRQDIAVTGSMNQHGEVQAVGGINQKIEGWFDICQARGLTGTQGVIIPFHNKIELSLKDSIIEAIKKDQFRIYAIIHVDDAMEILTGVKAGKRKIDLLSKDNSFEEGTCNFVIEQKLLLYSLLENSPRGEPSE
eukprot:TRINITY_DN6332_c0_g1_i1.p1 TRINITY_DN6332_c0_g1~~TRINITY_DN6332_c0_g1_i1.p1  ORF type:complete len:756 (-),score=225.44 TRINITY_DN6332_c0_g1_i1:42-2309(-)